MRGTYIGGPDGQAHKVKKIYIGVLEGVDKGIPLDLTNKSIASKYFDISLGNGASWTKGNLQVSTSTDSYESSTTTLKAKYKSIIQFQGYDTDPNYDMTIRVQKLDINGSTVLQTLNFDNYQSNTISTVSLDVGQFIKFEVINHYTYECGTSQCGSNWEDPDYSPCESCNFCDYCDSNCNTLCDNCNASDVDCDQCQGSCDMDDTNDQCEDCVGCESCDSCDGCQICQDQTECSEYEYYATTSSLLNMVITIDTSAADIQTAHKISKVYIGDASGKAKQVYPSSCGQCENCQDDCELNCEGACQDGESCESNCQDVCELNCEGACQDCESDECCEACEISCQSCNMGDENCDSCQGTCNYCDAQVDYCNNQCDVNVDDDY